MRLSPVFVIVSSPLPRLMGMVRHAATMVRVGPALYPVESLDRHHDSGAPVSTAPRGGTRRTTIRRCRKGHGARAWAGRHCQGPRRDRHPGESARVAIGAWRGQAVCRAACGDGSKHRHCRQIDVTTWSCIRFSVRCPPVGGHPLSFLNDLIRPSALPNPRSFGPSCRCAAARTTPAIGVPLGVCALRWRGRPGRLF